MIYLVIVILVCCYIFPLISYKKTSYYKTTHNSFRSVQFDKGRRGEYLTYKYLRNEEKSGAKLLFNAYLPKNDRETTEIDMILIHKNGIFVFESKNYSGWIFGNEAQKNWTQCLPKGNGIASQKEHFLNPIFQNKIHISALKQIVGESIPFYSIIVFSERCTLKDISVSDPMVKVINRNQVRGIVNIFASVNASKFSQTDIDSIYATLLPFTQSSNEVKEQHIRAIKNKQLLAAEAFSDKYNASPLSATNEKCKSEQFQSNVNLVCPICGGTLILRTATRGSNVGKPFYGCSNYPKCHYIHNI